MTINAGHFPVNGGFVLGSIDKKRYFPAVADFGQGPILVAHQAVVDFLGRGRLKFAAGNYGQYRTYGCDPSP